MNRLLLTAVAVLTMGVSGHAMAVTYTLDGFDTALSKQIVTYATNGGTGSLAAGVGDINLSYGGMNFTRDLSLAQDAATMASAQTAKKSTVQISNGKLSVTNLSGANSAVSLDYNIDALDTPVGGNNAVFTLEIKSTDANVGQESYISAFHDGALLSTWMINSPIALNAVPSLTHSWTISGADLDGTDQLKFVMTGANGYNTVLGPLTYQIQAADVLPVPEPGILPMIGSGLLVVGLAARRRRFATN